MVFKEKIEPLISSRLEQIILLFVLFKVLDERSKVTSQLAQNWKTTIESYHNFGCFDALLL